MKQIKHSSFRCQNVNSSLTKLSHSCFPIFLSGISQNGLGIWKAREIRRSHSYVSWLPISTKFKGSMVQIHLRYNKALTEDKARTTTSKQEMLLEKQSEPRQGLLCPGWNVKPGCPGFLSLCVSGEVWESQIFGSKESRGTQRKRPHLDCRTFFEPLQEDTTCGSTSVRLAEATSSSKQTTW